MYERFFGLEDEPFRLTPDPRYLYLSPKHAEALAHLRLGLTDSSGFVCITGDVGTGKTTLLRTFIAELPADASVAYILTPPQSTFDLLRSVCRELGCYVAGLSQGQLVEELHAYLVEQHKNQRQCVVVFDEAQAFSIELLEQVRLLLNLETETQKLLRIVLAGQPQLRKLLLDPGLAQLNQRITLRWHLGPLSYRETVLYVAHRLSIANGGRPALIFTVPALRLLHSVSGGVPRVINMVAHRALLAAYIGRQGTVTRRWVARAYGEIQAVPLPGTLTPLRKAAWAAAGLAIGVSAVVFGAPQIDWLFGTPPSAAVAERPAANPTAGKEPAPTPAAAAVAVAPLAKPPESTVNASAPSPSTYAAAQGLSSQDLERHLAGLDPENSARAATETILQAWKTPPLSADDASLETAVWRRGLHALHITANKSMLRLLDVPALLTVRAPGTNRSSFAAVVKMDQARIVLTLDGVPFTIDESLLEHFWSGQAHIVWRDFEALGPVLRRGARGVAVLKLQDLLHRFGQFTREPTGMFEEETETAVRAFQQAHGLDVDGVVGPLTAIVLYSAAENSYARPTLALSPQARS